ncbi:MAG: RNA polymerase sigma factor [Bacteroidota bacterium]
MSRLLFEMASQDFPKSILNAQHKLYRFALKILGSVQEAEDVVQEVFIKVWEKRWEMDHILNPEAWCMRMVKNRSLDKLKAKANQAHEAIESVKKVDRHAKPDSLAENKDMLKHISRIMDSLPEKQKMCMHLREIEGMSYEEITQALDLSMDQVKTNLYRARQKLRRKLNQLENVGINQG